MSRKTPRRALLAAVFAITALVLGGCAVVVSVTPSQPDLLGAVKLHTVICVGATRPDSSPCPPGNFGTGTTGSSSQLLVAYRVPANSDGAASALGTVDTGTSTAQVTFTRSDSYASELQRLSPAPAGEKWVGYVSDPTNTGGGPGADITLDPAFTLRQGADGSPFSGPFHYATVAGARAVNTGQLDPAQSVSCGDRLNGAQTTFVTTSGTTVTGITVCADSVLGLSGSPGSPSDPSNAPEQSLDVADAGVVPLATSAGSGSRSITVPFDLRFAGTAPAGTTFSLSGSTHVPGATVSVPVNTATAGSNSSTRVNAVLSGPGFTAGTYDVTLTATLPNGQSRSGTALVSVVNPSVSALRITKPTLSVKAPKTLTIDQFVNGFRVRGGCDIACSLRMRVLTSVRSSDVGAAGFAHVVATANSKSRAGSRNVTVVPCARGARSSARRVACRNALRSKLQRNGTTRVKLLTIATSRSGKRSRSTSYIRVH